MRTTGLLLVAATLIGAIPLPGQDEPNGIAAFVNDTIITYDEVWQESADAVILYERTYYNRPEELKQKRVSAMTEALQRLIDRQLVLFDFKNLGGVIQESYIDDAIKDKIRERFGDRVTLTKTLLAQGITSETYRQR